MLYHFLKEILGIQFPSNNFTSLEFVEKLRGPQKYYKMSYFRFFHVDILFLRTISFLKNEIQIYFFLIFLNVVFVFDAFQTDNKTCRKISGIILIGFCSLH